MLSLLGLKYILEKIKCRIFHYIEYDQYLKNTGCLDLAVQKKERNIKRKIFGFNSAKKKKGKHIKRIIREGKDF